MEHFGIAFIMLVMILMMSIVGRRVSDLASFRLRPACRLYFSPLFGLAVFILVFTIHGWIAPFRTGSSLAITAALVLPSLYFEKRKSTLLRYLSYVAAFSLIASSAVFFPLFISNTYSPFSDAFTYLVQGQWLQSHAFSDPAMPSSLHPAWTQVSLYQSDGSRMGGSFLLGWAQSMFGVDWSYYAYPAVVALPLIAGSLAVGGAVRLAVRGARMISALTAVAMATMLNGFVFGATFGFFPQTFGLAFAIGSTTMLAGVLSERQIASLRTAALNLIPAALTVAGLIVCYNDMLPLIAAGSLLFIAILLVRSAHRNRILIILAILFAEVALAVNLELVRMIRNFVRVLLDVGGGHLIIGWPVLWSPFTFLAHAFGLRYAIGSYWLLGYALPTFFVLILLLLSIVHFLRITAIKRAKSFHFVLMNCCVILTLAAGFIYFRYFGKAPTPAETGYTFLQFKLAKWASPFSFALMGAALAYIHANASGKLRRVQLIPLFLGTLISISTVANYKIAELYLPTKFLNETGYTHSAFSALLELRHLTAHLDPNDAIYVNLGSGHPQLSEMIAYILYDKKLAANYADMPYVFDHLPPDQRNPPFESAKWVIEYAAPDTLGLMNAPSAGNLILRKRPESMISRIAATGGYPPESDAQNNWNWTAQSIKYSYRLLGNISHVRVRFAYTPAVAGNAVRVVIHCNKLDESVLAMQAGEHEFISAPIDVGGCSALTVEFTSDATPVLLPGSDQRLKSFQIKNLEVERSSP